MESHRFTVFTATYNRANTLPRVYDSLLKQTFKDFEWVIIDDGSTDSTKELVDSWIKEEKIKIRYFFKENGGKHTAWRMVLNLGEGKYIITLDSDDEFVPETISVFNKNWVKIEKEKLEDDFAEIRALCIKQNGEVVGSLNFNQDSYYQEMFFKKRKSFEYIECNNLKKLKEHGNVPERFWLFKKAKNFPEGIRWSRMGRKFKTRFLSNVLRVYNYDGENSLCRGFNLKTKDRYYNALVGLKYYTEENLDYFFYRPIFFIKRFILFTTYCLVVGIGFKEMFSVWKNNYARIMWLLLFPFGWLFFAFNRLMSKND